MIISSKAIPCTDVGIIMGRGPPEGPLTRLQKRPALALASSKISGGWGLILGPFYFKVGAHTWPGLIPHPGPQRGQF